VQILINLIDFGMNLQEAGDAARIVHLGSSQPTGERMTDGGEVHLESGFGYETVRDLAQRGHAVTWAVGPFGGYQAVGVDPDSGVYVGASESRKDGQAAGY
jgi:gamma-glutamyltranspeptidase/glutathione hydrolase